MIGAIKKYTVIICVSEKISKEKMDTLRAYGAQVVICPATDYLEDPNSYHSQAVRIHKDTPNSFMPNQYFNVANAWEHYYSWGLNYGNKQMAPLPTFLLQQVLVAM